MAQIPYRANLSAAIYPFSLSHAGRAVVVSQADNNFDRRVDPEGAQKDAGIPQAIYMENVIPTAYGYQSIGFEDAETLPIPPFNTVSVVEDIIVVETGSEVAVTLTLIGFSDGTLVSSSYGGIGGWTAVSFTGTYPTHQITRIKTAICKDVCYVLLSWVDVPGLPARQTHLYTASLTGSFLVLTNISATVLPALTFGTIASVVIDIGSSYNYLCLLTEDELVWSSTTTPTDFVPSLVSGASSERPNSSSFKLQQLRPHPLGFVIYTASNYILTRYTGNAKYPWKFTPINDSSIPVDVFSSFTDPNHLVLEQGGAVKAVDVDTATAVAPEVTAFLERATTADVYDIATGTFTLETLSETPTVGKLYKYKTRYVLISCEPLASAQGGGFTVYSAIIVYDQLLRRYGKIKTPHTHIINGDDRGPSFALRGQFLGVLNAVTGICDRILFETLPEATGVGQGTLVLGKFQYIRSRDLVLDELTLEGVQDTRILGATPRTLTVKILTSAKGSVFTSVLTLTARSGETDDYMAAYNCRAEGRNLAVAISGQFSLATVEMDFHLGAKW